LRQMEGFLGSGLLTQTKSVAMFGRGGERPFFLPLQFGVPLPNWIAVSATPCIYHLVDLEDTYACFVVMLATDKCVRILGVHLGAVVEDIRSQRSELRLRVGREWTKQHYENHRRERTHRFVNEQIRLLNRVVAKREYGHLFLAGNPRVTSQIKNALPHHLAAKLVDVLPTSEY